MLDSVVGASAYSLYSRSHGLEEAVAAYQDEGVLHSVGIFGVEGGVADLSNFISTRRDVVPALHLSILTYIITKAHASGEKDLPTSSLPDIWLSKLVSVPRGKVQLNASASVFQRSASADENDRKDDWQAHGEVDGATSHADATVHAKKDAEPGEGGPADRLPNETEVGVGGEALHGAVCDHSWDGIDLAKDLLVVELFRAARPWQWAREAMSKVYWTFIKTHAWDTWEEQSSVLMIQHKMIAKYTTTTELTKIEASPTPLSRRFTLLKATTVPPR